MRKVIRVPEDVGQIRFAEFLRSRLGDAAWGRSFDLLLARAEVLRAFEAVSPGDRVSLRRSDWEILAACTRQPSQPYNPEVMGLALGFISAIVDAVDADDEKGELS